TTFAIGTEINLVQRLAAEHPQHTIFCLDPVICPCSTMYRIHPGYIAWVVESLLDGEGVNQISGDDSVAGPARESRTRMRAPQLRVSCAPRAPHRRVARQQHLRRGLCGRPRPRVADPHARREAAGLSPWDTSSSSAPASPGSPRRCSWPVVMPSRW